MRVALRIVGILLLSATAGAWKQALAAPPGTLALVSGFLMPIAWAIAGYGLLRLREWGRQLGIIMSASFILYGVAAVVLNRTLSPEAIAALLLGVNGAFLLISKKAIAAVAPARAESGVEPRIEGWTAAAGALIAFGVAWIGVAGGLTLVLAKWYLGLGLFLKFLLFMVAGGYFVWLLWLTFAAPVIVARYFYQLAVEDEQRREAAPVHTALS